MTLLGPAHADVAAAIIAVERQRYTIMPPFADATITADGLRERVAIALRRATTLPSAPLAASNAGEEDRARYHCWLSSAPTLEDDERARPKANASIAFRPGITATIWRLFILSDALLLHRRERYPATGLLER